MNTATSRAQLAPMRLTLLVGVVVGLNITGDALLYGVLPLEAERLGLALPLVGVLLSANRLVRLATNTPVGALFERWGPRWPFLLAALLGVLTTLLYGLGAGFLVFLGARLGWGLAWSGLRLGGFYAVWSGPLARRGRLMGLLGATISVGATAAVLLGGYLRDTHGYQTAMLIMAAATTAALPLAAAIPWPAHTVEPGPRRSLALAEWLPTLAAPRRLWLLIAIFVHLAVTETVLTTGALFVRDRLGVDGVAAWGIGLGSVAGALLAVRFLADSIAGPLLGAFSDRVGQGRLALLLSALMLAALAAVTQVDGLWVLLCLALSFITAAGVTLTLDAAATRIPSPNERPQLFLAAYATAFDAGLSVGPLAGLALAGRGLLPALYVGGGALALLVMGLFAWAGRRGRESEVGLKGADA